MLINSETLLDLKVETESGRHLGQVNNFDVDTETHLIKKYYISSDNIIRRILKSNNDLIISPGQVISITSKKMIVSDLLLKQEAYTEVEKQTVPSRKAAAYSVKTDE